MDIWNSRQSAKSVNRFIPPQPKVARGTPFSQIILQFQIVFIIQGGGVHDCFSIFILFIFLVPKPFDRIHGIIGQMILWVQGGHWPRVFATKLAILNFQRLSQHALSQNSLLSFDTSFNQLLVQTFVHLHPVYDAFNGVRCLLRVDADGLCQI